MKILRTIFTVMVATIFATSVSAQGNYGGLKVGDQVPQFSYKDVNDKVVTLADFAGKYIYLDIWATWCGPCNAQIEPLKAIEKGMEGKNIVFLSLSLDQNVNDWKNMVKDKDMKGVQIHSGGKKDLVDAFEVTGIPRFIIIGPDGKVVDPDAMRPSKGEMLIKYLGSLPGMSKK